MNQVENTPTSVASPPLLAGSSRLVPWDIDDPFYTLNAFKHAHEGINFAKWEHPSYQSLLTRAAQEIDPIKRQHYIAQSEALLIEETPLIPIYYELQQYVKKSHIQLPCNTESGFCSSKTTWRG